MSERYSYIVKRLEGATLEYGIYRVADDAPPARTLVAMAINHETADFITYALSIRERIEHERHVPTV